MINYDQLVTRMKENGITSFTIKKGQPKEGFMSQCTYTRMKLNQGYIGLEIIEKILNELNIDKIQLVRDNENNFEIIIKGKWYNFKLDILSEVSYDIR